ncbi:hypothetical protein F0P96_05110 [Hymenobacter busanensis]|uniref:Uncharacterized protein n=1 Tax=Hymenobacter busanensis TaxID=2607656 RepID=A0A7L5A1F0_9BACT|nr:hypothetical protein [Hymenobacter busanensis]KAA9338228.1 hypothetical protein F0P96_05110 [Hymenobacter busanensis]QHJ09348.1 hypothetical protein GUY19_19500 [Hymenobacter busanensis]
MASETVERFVHDMRARMAQDAHTERATQVVLLRRLLAVVRALLPYEPQAIVPGTAPWTEAAALEARWRNGRTLVIATRCRPFSPDSRLTLYKYNEISLSLSVAHEQLPAALGLCLGPATVQQTTEQTTGPA